MHVKQTQLAYRIVEIKNNQPYTLFHGIKRSRLIPVNKWISAEQKWVSDGGTQYWSGFHVMLSEDACFDYMYRFKAIRCLAVVDVIVTQPLRKKQHSPHNIYLANDMFLTWPNRCQSSMTITKGPTHLELLENS